MKASEVEELTDAFKAVKTKMATELEANVEVKEKLETDLTSTKHSLLEVKHQLNMAEKVCICIKGHPKGVPENCNIISPALYFSIK